MEENPKVVWAKFSTLSWVVFVKSVIAWHAQARPHLELKNRPMLCPANLSLSTNTSRLGDTQNLATCKDWVLTPVSVENLMGLHNWQDGGTYPVYKHEMFC